MNLDVHPCGFGSALRSLPPVAATLGFSPAPRYAIHYTPAPDAAITQLATAWFGRDLYTRTPCERIARPGLEGMDLDRLTPASADQAFRSYLTEPFELAGHASEATLIDAAQRFAAARGPFTVALELADFDRILALVLRAPSEAMNTLQAACVKAFGRHASAGRHRPQLPAATQCPPLLAARRQPCLRVPLSDDAHRAHSQQRAAPAGEVGTASAVRRAVAAGASD